MTIFEELRADHDKQRALIEHIEATQGDEMSQQGL